MLASPALVDNLLLPPQACAGRLRDFVVRTLGLVKLLEQVEDVRRPERKSVTTVAVLRGVLMGFVLNLGSIRGTEDRLKRSAGFRVLADVKNPMSDDTMRDVLTRVAHAGLEAILHATARRELLRWGAGRYRESLLARRLAALNCSFLAAKAVVALDGHETHCSEKVRCADCHTRTKTVKRGKGDRHLLARFELATEMALHPVAERGTGIALVGPDHAQSRNPFF